MLDVLAVVDTLTVDADVIDALVEELITTGVVVLK